MSDIELSSDIGVTFIDSMGNDNRVVAAARVSIVGAQAEYEKGERAGLIRFLMDNSHTSPFEHVVATFMLEVPIFVAREWMRHRTQSFNEVSGRYSVLKGKFYVPAADRPLTQVGKPGSYSFEAGSEGQRDVTLTETGYVYEKAWNSYEYMLSRGIAKEVARDVLPVGIYTSFYATANLHNWMHFLSLRTDPTALHEIRLAAHQVEAHLRDVAPACMDAFLNVPVEK